MAVEYVEYKMKGTIKAGSYIACPNQCGEKVIADVIEDIHMGRVLEAKNLRGHYGPISDGDATDCPGCGASWCVNGRLFTEKGWQP